MAKKMNGWDYLSIILLIVGGLNWGLFGLVNFNLVEWIADMFGYNIVAKLIYTFIFASAVYSSIRLATLK